MSETADKKAARKAKKASRGEKDEKIFKRPELAGAVADKTGLPRTKASAAVEAVFDILSEKLKEGQEVRLVGFGAFVVTERKAGKGRDPRTGAEIDIPKSKSVRFRPGKPLREAVGGRVKAAAAAPAEEGPSE
jgi:DNA-binding protein HU-beta